MSVGKIFITTGLLVFFIVSLVSLKSQYKQARNKALNELSPDSFDDLVDMIESKIKLSNERLTAYLNYFKEVSQFSPTRVDAVGLAGFCYSYLGNDSKAIEQYEKAAQDYPQFIGFHHNLAVLYFKNHHYEKTVEEVDKIRSVDPKESLRYILSFSKPYAFMMLRKMNKKGISIEEQFKKMYQNAARLKEISEAFIGKNEILLDGKETLLETY